MTENQPKTFTEWIFDLDEYLSGEGLPMRSEAFERGALVYGFTNDLAPEAFVRDSCNRPDRAIPIQPSTSARVIATDSQTTPAERQRKTPILVVAACAVALAVVLLGVGAFRLHTNESVPYVAVAGATRPDAVAESQVTQQSGLRGSTSAAAPIQSAPKVDQDAEQPVEALEALQSATRVGLDYDVYKERTTDTQIKVDAYFARHSETSEIGGLIKDAMNLYDEAALTWERFAVNGYPGLLPNINPDHKDLFANYISRYPSLRSAVTEDDGTARSLELPYTDITQAIWSDAGKHVRKARSLLNP